MQSQMNILILLSISTNLNPGQRRKSFVKITPIHGCQESIGIVKDKNEAGCAQGIKERPGFQNKA